MYLTYLTSWYKIFPLHFSFSFFFFFNWKNVIACVDPKFYLTMLSNHVKNKSKISPLILWPPQPTTKNQPTELSFFDWVQKIKSSHITTIANLKYYNFCNCKRNKILLFKKTKNQKQKTKTKEKKLCISQA